MNRRAVARELVAVARDLTAIDWDKPLAELDEESRQFSRDLEENGWEEKGIGFYFHRKHPTIFVDVNGIQGQVLSNAEEHELEVEFVDDYAGLLRWLKSKHYRKHLNMIRVVHDLDRLESRGWKKVEHHQSIYYLNPKYPDIAIADFSILGHFYVVGKNPRGGWAVDRPLGKAETVKAIEALAKKIAEDIKEDDEPYIEAFLEGIEEFGRREGVGNSKYISRIHKVPRGIGFKFSTFSRDLSSAAGNTEVEITIAKPKRGPWVVTVDGYGRDYKRIRARAKGGEQVPSPADVSRVLSGLGRKTGFTG